VIAVTQRNTATGKVSEPTKVAILALEAELSAYRVHSGEALSIYGHNFRPDEEVSITVHSTLIPVAKVKADNRSYIEYLNWAIPADLEPGIHIIVLSGTISGDVTVEFEVLPPEPQEPQEPQKPEEPRTPEAPQAPTGGEAAGGNVFWLGIFGLLLAGFGVSRSVVTRRK
jgi:hypothetical protein